MCHGHAPSRTTSTHCVIWRIPANSNGVAMRDGPSPGTQGHLAPLGENITSTSRLMIIVTVLI